jgi:elongation of very long chain fatty acids protein 6
METATAFENMTAANQSYMFAFERNYNDYVSRTWLKERQNAAIGISGLYLITIFGIQRLMKDKPKYDLRYVLVLWNMLLAGFSIMGAYRTIPPFLHALFKRGMNHAVCTVFLAKPPTAVWIYLFALSKVPELGDTLFIVLRKQKLIFLHWYHHIVTLYVSWWGYTDLVAPSQWYMVFNYAIHSLMYTYYTLKMARINVPRPVAMLITTSQILQMFVGMFVNLYSYMRIWTGGSCAASLTFLNVATLMYLSYAVLFIHFFSNSYVKPKQKQL